MKQYTSFFKKNKKYFSRKKNKKYFCSLFLRPIPERPGVRRDVLLRQRVREVLDHVPDDVPRQDPVRLLGLVPEDADAAVRHLLEAKVRRGAGVVL